jgi:hypothetical protein
MRAQRKIALNFVGAGNKELEEKEKRKDAKFFIYSPTFPPYMRKACETDLASKIKFFY